MLFNSQKLSIVADELWLGNNPIAKLLPMTVAERDLLDLRIKYSHTDKSCNCQSEDD